MILVIGEPRCKVIDLINAAKKLGFSEDDFDFISDYSKIQNYNWGSLKNSSIYTDVICGQMKHHCGKSGKYSDVMQKMQNEKGFPNIIKAGGGSLKITISSFRKDLQNTIYYKNNLTNNK